MELRDHLRTTGSALKNWFIAQLQDSLAVGLLWLIGLWIIGIPLAPLWALLAAGFQFIPHIGGVLALIGPVLAAIFTDRINEVLYIGILYAVIAVVDGLILQPYIMKRTVRVPIWASILTPIVLGIVLPGWGVLLAAPALAIFYAYKARKATPAPPLPPPDYGKLPPPDVL